MSSTAAKKPKQDNAGIPANVTQIEEKDLIAAIESGTTTYVLNALITPRLAEIMLQYNDPGVTNRPVMQYYVNQLKHNIEHNLWNNTGEPIIFSDAKKLNDGEHRLVAVCETGLPIVCDIRFGVARQAFDHTNTGRTRRVTDILALRGVPHRNNLASMARLLLLYQYGLPTSAYRRIQPGTAEVLDCLDQHPDMLDVMMAVRSQVGARLFSSSPVLVLAFFARRTAARGVANKFFHTVLTGEGTAQEPAHEWRESFLLGDMGRRRDRRLVGLATGIMAWNEHRKPGSVKRPFRWNASQPYPVVAGLTL
jgi:hypothetical protein